MWYNKFLFACGVLRALPGAWRRKELELAWQGAARFVAQHFVLLAGCKRAAKNA